MDRYTKTVLTVIAASLAVIAFKMPISTPAGAFGDGCGDIVSPCFVQTSTVSPLDVWVKNLR